MDDRAIARWRLQSLRLAGRSYASATAAVQGLLAVQAENHAQASWAVADRTTGVSEAEFAALFDGGAILRTHVLRPTWHFVDPADVRWLADITAPRLRRLISAQHVELGLDQAVIEAATGVIADTLAGGKHATRAQLAERLTAEGLPSSGRQLAMIMLHVELSALVCSGVRQGREHTYALLEERAPGSRQLDDDEALAELALRYFSGHGPATERDLAYWATLTLTDVRTALAAVADQLQHLEHDGRTYWFCHAPPAEDVLEPRGHLLQILDEYYRGYQDSRYVLDADGLLTKGREPSIGMALVDGQMVGAMRRKVGSSRVRLEVSLLRELRPDERIALEDAAGRYGEFLGLEPVLDLSA
jgi:hypothetical protein